MLQIFYTKGAAVEIFYTKGAAVEIFYTERVAKVANFLHERGCKMPADEDGAAKGLQIFHLPRSDTYQPSRK